jgi:toxin ParE1/3/4
MSLSVVFLKSAEQDLKELKIYLVRNFGQASWQGSYKAIKKSVGMLQTFPLKGKIPDELENLNLTQYRQIISGMNRIICEVRQETVFIHIVCDTRKDMQLLLTKRLLRVI